MLNGHGKLEKAKTREKISAMILDGLNDAQIANALTAAKCPVSRQAVFNFRKRHPELKAAIAEVARQVEDAAIARQVNRIHEYQSLYDGVHSWQEEHGLSEIAQRFDAKTGNLIGETITLNTGLVNAKHQILEAVAKELDQLPRGTTAIDNRVQILIRSYEGFDPELLT